MTSPHLASNKLHVWPSINPGAEDKVYVRSFGHECHLTETEAREAAATLVAAADELADRAAAEEAEAGRIKAVKRTLDLAYGNDAFRQVFGPGPRQFKWCGTWPIATWLVRSGLTVKEAE